MEDHDSLLNLLSTAQGVTDFLRDPVVDSDAKLAGWRRFYESPKSRQHPRERGVIGLKLFTVDAESAVSDESKSAIDDFLLGDPDTKSALFAVYEIEIPDVVCRHLQFHQVGTTSFIIRAGEKALKLIKPRYWGIGSIEKATCEYGSTFGALGDFAPKIEADHSHKRWICMTFIDAPTLSEFMRLKVVREFEPLERLAVFEAVMGGICMALQSCLKQRRNHLDLSPDNVLVSHTYGRVNKIWLIDFGVNYLLREGLGVSRARAEVFFAPELKRRSALGDDMSDVYSLGMIMMELLLGEELKISTYMDRLDKVWESHPEFGEVIEDMIDPQQEDSSGVQPINRLMLFDREGNVFETIGYKVEKLVRLRRDRSTIPHPLLQLTDVLQNFVPIATLIQLSSDWVRSKNRPARRLYLWLWGAHLVELVTIFAFVVFMLFPFWPLYNWRACSSIGGCLLNIQSPPLPRFNGALAGRVNGFLPGRLVALSFSLVLTAYYANIFSTIQTKHLSSSDRRWLPVLVDIIMRTCPFFGAVPVLWAMIVDPKAWPFCSALGLAMVGLNNWWSYRFVRYALDKMKTQLRCPFTKSVEDQINQFSSWWWMIALYSASLVVVGSLLVLGAAKDEWLYAVFVVVFVNFLKMQMDNCGESAPGVRGLLRRLATGLARARAAAASTTPSNAAVLTVANGR